MALSKILHLILHSLRSYSDHLLQLFFAEQFFKLFDKDRSGTISLSELIDGLNMLMEGSDMDKLKFLFDVYDVDG